MFPQPLQVPLEFAQYTVIQRQGVNIQFNIEFGELRKDIGIVDAFKKAFILRARRGFIIDQPGLEFVTGDRLPA